MESEKTVRMALRLRGKKLWLEGSRKGGIHVGPELGQTNEGEEHESEGYRRGGEG